MSQPPTPGLASWIYNSVFSKETPSQKYFRKESVPDVSDTVGHRNSLGASKTSMRDEEVRRRYLRDRELLPDFNEDDDTFHHRRSRISRARTPQSLHRRANSVGNPMTDHEKISLNHPGKFPSPWHRTKTSYDVPSSPPRHKQDILSSTSKNVELAGVNAMKNRNVIIDSSPIVIPRRPSESKSHRETVKPITVPTYVPDYHADDLDDEKEIMRMMDSNNEQLKRITKDVNSWKSNLVTASSDYEKLQKKYASTRAELIAELKRTEKLYDSYYRYVDKYKRLKEIVETNGVKDIENVNAKVDSLEFDKMRLEEHVKTLETQLKTQKELHKEEIGRKDDKIRGLERLVLRDSPRAPLKENTNNYDDTLELINRKYPDRLQDQSKYKAAGFAI